MSTATAIGHERDPDWTVAVSYATAGLYARLLADLRTSCQVVGVPLVDVVVPSAAASWAAGTHAKLDHLVRWRSDPSLAGRPLLWVDADALVLADPRPALAADLADPRTGQVDADVGMAGRYVPTGPLTLPTGPAAQRRKWAWFSGTIWLADTDGARRLLVSWRDRCRTDPSICDQSHAAAAITEAVWSDGLRIAGLRPGLAWVESVSAAQTPGVAPIIGHYQASRTTRWGKHDEYQRAQSVKADHLAELLKTHTEDDDQ